MGTDRKDIPMRQLTWSFDWPVLKAVAVASHGTYVISGEAPGRWMAQYRRSDTQPYRRSMHPVAKELYFPTMADAMRACHRHAENFDWESSDRLSVVTPRPS